MNNETNKDYWFRPRYLGWGFTPISWQGWLATIALIGMVLLSAGSHGFFTRPDTINQEDGLGYLFDIIVLLTIFSLIALPRTKGRVKWRWNKPAE